MGLRDCLISAVEQGALSREEASALGDEFDERFAQLRASLGDAPARAQARVELEAALRATALEARRRADLREAARLQAKAFLQAHRNAAGEPDVFEGAMALLSHYGYRGGSSVRGRMEAIVGMAHGKLEDLMWAYRRSAGLGARRRRVLDRDLVRELRGEDSGNPDAKGFARSLETVLEDLRGRFNAAGGAIPRLEKWGLPQSHDRAKVLAIGRDAAARRAEWKAFIAPLLDPDRMLNPLTKAPVGKAGLDRALDHVFDTLVSDDWAHAVPSMIPTGRGALATQRQDHRFLVFRDAESWQAYHARFGRGDIAQVIFDHINGMARDIAAMEILGPNPQAMVEWLKQVVRHEIGQMEAGRPSLASHGTLERLFGPTLEKVTTRRLDASLGDYATHRLDSLYMDLRGRPHVISGLANRMDDARNLAGSAVLGSTAILAAATDPWIASAARRLAALPQTGLIMESLKNLPRGNRRDIVRAGVIWSDFLHVMGDEVRFMQAGGSNWSRWLLDRTVTLSGLAPLTDARKLTEARAWQAHLADEADKTFDALDERLRVAMAGFGIGPAEWDIMRNAVDINGFVTPAEIARRGGDVRYIDLKRPPTPADAAAELRALAHRGAAEKLAELTSSWNERAVPSGTPNARSAITGTTQRGTITGELVNLFTQLKSFPLSFTALQIEAIGRAAATDPSGRAWGGGKYFAMMAIPMTLGAAVAIQLRGMADGKDPEDMADPKFMAKAAVAGGGAGLLGDFAQASDSRFGGSFFESLMGPGAALIGDTLGLTAGNAMQLWQGEDTKIGREAARFMGRWTPGLSSHWATRAAYRRIIVDQLQHLVDPEADRSFKAQQQSLKRRTGQEFYWPPGSPQPARAPDFGALTGE